MTDPYVASVTASATVTVNLQDLNEAPIFIDLQHAVSSLEEMTDTSHRTKIGDIVVTDDSGGVNVLTLSGADSAAFEIENTILYLKAGTILDFETKSRYVVNINADDPLVGLSPDAYAIFELNVTDVNEAPTAITFANTVPSLPENTNPLVRLKVANPVIADDALGENTLALSGADAASFEVDNTGLYLKAGTLLDFETKATYAVTVTVDDVTRGASPDASANFVLKLTDVNDLPVVGRRPSNPVVNDDATTAPFASYTLADADTQDFLVRVTIVNGVNRGDFTPASVAGWTRTVNGYDLVYGRYFSPHANIGAVVEPVLQGLVFQPRSNAIKPNSTELTDISVFVNDGMASSTTTSRITTVSRNDAPTLGVANIALQVDDNATVNPLSTLTVADRDTQEMLISVTILNGVYRGDFTNATSSGWTARQVLGNDITYRRYFSPTANVGAAAEAAFRALTFQPRGNAIRPGTTELTDFQETVSDGVAPAIANTSVRVTTASMNNVPALGGLSTAVMVGDNATVNPFGTLTLTDNDTQEMLISVTILNGVYRGDFTNATSSGWTARQVLGNDITYRRYFSPTANVGAAAEAAFRALTFQPRSQTLVPGAIELTDFQVTVSDGVAPAMANSGTRVTTTSINDAPVIGGALAGQVVHPNTNIQPFAALTVTDPDLQDMLARVTIPNGVELGDFSSDSTPGWTRNVIGSNIVYSRYFSPAANIGTKIQSVIRAFDFQSRSIVPVGQVVITSFLVSLQDGNGATVTNNETSVFTIGVA